jgi:hypothetical protein
MVVLGYEGEIGDRAWLKVRLVDEDMWVDLFIGKNVVSTAEGKPVTKDIIIKQKINLDDLNK